MLRTILAIIAVLVGVDGAGAQSPRDPVSVGRDIFMSGVLGSGAPLVARRDGGVVVQGRPAACAACHRPSGFGAAEASVRVPPVTGPALFENAKLAGAKPRRARGMTYQDFGSNRRPAYRDETLARAIREGLSPDGTRFHYLMPRYDLAASDMSALIAYLRQLSATQSPGVVGLQIHVATIVAPGQVPARKAAMIEVLDACLAERYPATREAAIGVRLHTWQLAGEPHTWSDQLRNFEARQPVFAAVSGLGGTDWQAMHAFCEARALPCLFPNVAAAGAEQESRYNFYFSQGLVLEAKVAAKYLDAPSAPQGINRIVQVRAADGVGSIAAAAFRRTMGEARQVEDRVLAGHSNEDFAAAVADLGPDDALVLWLDRSHLAAINAAAPPPVRLILASSLLEADQPSALTPAWRQGTSLIYPFDAPARLKARMTFNLHPWLNANGIALIDERLQGNTLAACSLLTESIARLRGAYVRDRLVELIEDYPAAMGNAPAAQAFPRFSLGPGQRFSSKGAYIVRFAADGGEGLELSHDWIVP